MKFLVAFLINLGNILFGLALAVIVVVAICLFVDLLISGSASIGMASLGLFILFFTAGVLAYNEVYRK